MKYQIIIFWDFDNKNFVAEVPELDGCSATGETHAIALDNCMKAMKKWANRAFASSILVPQPIGRLPLRDELYCINCKQQSFTTGKWKRSKE